MARIAGINIPMNKHVCIGLTAIFGVGRSQALAACEAAGVKTNTKVKDLTEAEVTALRSAIAKLPVEGDLRREDAGTAHAHQCAHAQGPAQGGGQAERTSGQGVSRPRPVAHLRLYSNG